MKTPLLTREHLPPRRLARSLGAALALALALTFGAPASHGAASPPDLMPYQGFLVDGNGNALAPTTPQNYPVIFRVYGEATGNSGLLWAEQQIVTVDKGNFSVLLGEGTPVGGDPRPALSSIFSGNTASDRYISIWVTISGNTLEILPRLRLVPSPYAFLATSALNIVRPDGSTVLNYNGGQVNVTGNLNALGTFSGNGSGLTALNAGNIGAGVLDAARIPGLDASKIVTGAFGDGRIPSTLGGNRFFTGSVGIGTASPNAPLSFGGGLGNTKLALWDGGPGTMYGFGIQNGQFRFHVNTSGDRFSFLNGVSGTEVFTVRGSGNVQAVGGFQARGGAPGPGGANNNGYAFSGNGGDNDSGMFSDVDGHIRFYSNDDLKLTVRPSDVYAHARLHADSGLTVNTGYGRTAEITAYWLRLFHPSDKSKLLDIDRVGNGVRIGASGGGFGNASGDYRQIVWDGDGNWDVSSDRKLKKDIEDAEPVLERALKVQLRRFHWKEESADAKKTMGVIAQELQPLFPDMVGETETKETGEKHLTVGYSDFGMIAIKALQELKAQHDAETADLKSEISKLKSQMADVLRLSAQLMNKVEKGKVTAAVQP